MKPQHPPTLCARYRIETLRECQHRSRDKINEARKTGKKNIKQAELQAALQSIGWNQSDLAKNTGICPQEIAKIINMRTKPTTEQAVNILKALREKGYEIDLLVSWLEDSQKCQENQDLVHSKEIPLGELIHSHLPQLTAESNYLDVIENKEILLKLMEALSKKEQLAITKYFFENETYQSIAESLGVSHQRATQVVSQAFKKMKKRAQILGVTYRFEDLEINNRNSSGS